jgi:hypothetical protein
MPPAAGERLAAALRLAAPRRAPAAGDGRFVQYGSGSRVL